AERLDRQRPSGSGQGVAVAKSQLAADYLMLPILRPEQRAALFRVLAKAVGTRAAETTDPAGRRALGISFVDGADPAADEPGTRIELMVDPQTSHVRALRATAVKAESGLRAGQVLAQVEFGEWQVVDNPFD